jgi:hypothetical protein
MQITSSDYICSCCGKPRRLAHLMEIYEHNFRLLQRLLPELNVPFENAISTSETDPPLHLTVLSRDRYTLTVKLTYEFIGEDGARHHPDLWIRVYRDAEMVEALDCSHRPPWLAEEGGDPEVGRFLNHQWGRNLMLGKWLDYLLERGHGFGMTQRPRVVPVAA